MIERGHREFSFDDLLGKGGFGEGLRFDQFEDFKLEAIDPSKYWYVKNPAAPPPYTVYHAQGTSPRLELVEDASHPSGYSLAIAAKKAEHVFGPGTTKQQALDFITQPGRSFAPYREMLLEYDIATDESILKAMIEPAGATEETIRHLLKEHYHTQVLGRMFVEPGGDALEAAESVDAYHGITKNLNSSDGGKLGEEWYDRYSDLFNGERLEKHPSYKDSTGGKRLPDFIRRGGKIEGNTAVEVKSTTKGLNSDHDIPQIEEMLKLAQRKGSVDVGGRPVKISSGKVVFTHESGAAGSIDDLKRLFVGYDDVLTIEVVFSDGPQSFGNIVDLRAALGV